MSTLDTEPASGSTNRRLGIVLGLFLALYLVAVIAFIIVY